MTFNVQNISISDNLELAAAVEAAAAETSKHDGIDPFSEQFLFGLRDARLNHQHWIIESAGKVEAVAASDGSSAELFVVPDARQQGRGIALLEAVLPTPVWAHGNFDGAQALAQAKGLRMTRHLLVMAIEEDALKAAAQKPQTELVVANYAQSVERFGKEHVERQWLKSNNQAFSWHPEQGGWDIERLHRGMEPDWFDEEDVIFFWDVPADSAQQLPEMAGFHWTKWHDEVSPGFGEVYVVGLSDDYRGRRLGGPLLNAGLQRMVEKGATRVILYVEADNEPAVKAYERLGFKIAENHVVYEISDMAEEI